MTINELIQESYSNAKKHGFWEEDMEFNREEISNFKLDKYLYDCTIGNKLMLIVSEIGEAQEGLRHGDKANFREELADVAIRLADLCGGLNIDLESEIEKKMKINERRPYKHGKQF